MFLRRGDNHDSEVKTKSTDVVCEAKLEVHSNRVSMVSTQHSE